jgi:AcrR family transcriptional regulator
MNEKEKTKEKISQVSVKLFALKGYDAVGVAEICTKANVSKGTFYYHFESKEILFLTLLENWLQGIDQKLITISEQNLSWDEGIQFILLFLKELALEASKQNIIFIEFYSKAIRNKTVWNRLDKEMVKYQSLLAGLIQKGIDQKMIKPVDVHMTAKTVIALIMGLLLEHWLTSKEQELSSLLEHTLKIFLGGIQI